MKKKTLRAMAALLAVTIALTPLAGASQALGSEIHTVRETLSEGVEVTRQYLWSATYSDLRTEHYLTYTPAEGIRPVLAYGDKITSKQTLTAMAQQLERQGKRVLGGINGDYYVVKTGAPLGMVITEGELKSTSQYDTSWALGFREDGTAFISRPELSVTVSFGGQTLAVTGGINKVRGEQGGYYLLTEDFASSTLNTEEGIDVILRPLWEELGSTVTVERPAPAQQRSEEQTMLDDSAELTSKDAAAESVTKEDVLLEETPAQTVQVTLTRGKDLAVNSRISCSVQEVIHSQEKREIPEGCFILTINKKGNPWLQEQLSSLTAGQKVEIDVVSLNPEWEQAVTAVGGMYKLVTGGVAEEGLSTEQHPRSAVGVKPDGSTVFYTIDGRQSGYSVGAGMDQVARRLVELGCVEAICLDGGGSTTLGVTWPDDTALAAINRPSEGKQRANSNALLLVSERSATGVPDRFHITPNDNVLLAGASLQLSAAAVDTNGFPMDFSGPLTWSVQEGEGSITQEGLFTAGFEEGPVFVSVTDGTRTGTVCIRVVSTPQSLKIFNQATGVALTSLHLEPGQSLDLAAAASYWNLPVNAAEENFVWTAEPGVGQVDNKGVFTAVPQNSKGYLTVSAGTKSVFLPVTVSGHILPMEDFEGDVYFIDTDTALVEPEFDLEKVRYGEASAKVSYQAKEGRAIFGTNLPVVAGEKILSLWVYGDGSGNQLLANFAGSDGSLTEVQMTPLEFTGWRQVLTAIPEGAVSLQSIALSCGEQQGQSGVFWLDQMTTANGQAEDLEAPVIDLRVTDGILQATITDGFDAAVAAERISVTLDGQKLDFAWDSASAKLTLALPQGTGKLHRVSVTAADISGNLARAGCDYTELEQPADPFLDMEGHWAQSYTAYLHQQGVTTGVAVEDGFVFQPDKAISRGEFALMVMRWMGLKAEDYAQVELPFADLDQIPEWMLPAMRAMYAEGIIKGSAAGGKLYANATQSISRTESMTLLGRTQAKGFPAGELNFADADQVPSWALEYVQSLVAQGVVSGYNNQLTPNAPVTRGAVAKMLVSMT